MAASETVATTRKAGKSAAVPASREIVLEQAANEVVFGVVGHVGSGTSEIARALEALLEGGTLPGGSFDTEIIKARDRIADWARETGLDTPDTPDDDLTTVENLQDLGDEMRKASSDYAAVAKALVLQIRKTRAKKIGLENPGADPVPPDGARRAYILDSIRHPAEVQLLRHIYRNAFALVGVVCEEKKRLARLVKKYTNAGETNAKIFMERDAKASEPHGQRVSDAFHLSDFFVDNTMDRFLEGQMPNPDWNINEKLSRLVKIITHSEIVRPEISETAMRHAYGAQMRSACLSRQVGAVLVDNTGNIIATGTNEVPKAGGGVYGTSFASEDLDDRCAFRRTSDMRFCSNTREQNRIIIDLISEIPELSSLGETRKAKLQQQLRKTRIGGLLEFSRAVHAEMDALISAARQGISPVGARLFVTTFPCHYCARHLVAAGIDEVQYIEPYPKSQALDLHDDSVQVDSSRWKPPSQGGTRVLFHPFAGVAPILYSRAFLKDRDLKNSDTGDLAFGAADWGGPWHLGRVSYVELEAKLAKSEN